MYAIHSNLSNLIENEGSVFLCAVGRHRIPPRNVKLFSLSDSIWNSLRVSSKWQTLYKAKIPFTLLLAPPLIIDVLSTNGNLCWICMWAINVCIIKTLLWGFTNFFHISDSFSSPPNSNTRVWKTSQMEYIVFNNWGI